MPREANDLIHQPVRLKIMAALNGLGTREFMDFTKLKRVIEATDGNLGAHLSKLEDVGYIAVEKDFIEKKPRTRVALTREGRQALETHVAYLRDILEGVGGQ